MTAAADGFDLVFGGAYPLSESAEVALEDYARALAQAREAVALRRGKEGGPREAGGQTTAVHGVHLAAPALPITPGLTRDVEDFARALAQDGRNDRLGWS